VRISKKILIVLCFARLVSERRAVGEEWLRLAVILVVVALVTFLAARVVRIPPASPESAAAD